MVEDDIEFFAMALIALLKQQQSVQNIPEQIFRRKFTTLFRLYEPLLQELYDRPAKLISTFLLWENNFFARVPKLHHRDEARRETMDAIIKLITDEVDADEVEDTVQVKADALLEKIEQQRIKSEDIKERKKQAKGKTAKKKPKSTFQMNDEQGESEKSAHTRILGYVKELEGSIAEADTAVRARAKSGKPAERVHADQPLSKSYIQRLTKDTTVVLDKATSAGVSADDIGKFGPAAIVVGGDGAPPPAAEVAELPKLAEAELTYWRTNLPMLRHLAILQSQCHFIEIDACWESLRALRFAFSVLQEERQRLRKMLPTNAAEAEHYIELLTGWETSALADEEGMNDEYNLATEERLNIERKEKFAKYIGAVKSNSLKLDGDLDEQFQVKAKFQPAANDAAVATAAKSAADKQSSQSGQDTRAELLQRGRAMQGQEDGDESD